MFLGCVENKEIASSNLLVNFHLISVNTSRQSILMCTSNKLKSI